MARGRKTGGRSKGTPNKITRELREMILGALSEVGGQQYLTAQARENPNAFMRLLGQTLPRNVKLEAGLELEVNLVSRRPTGN